MRFWPSRLRRGPKKKNGRDRAWNRFVHQELTGYSPIMTGNRVLAFFLLATLILIPLGAAILAASLGVVEYKARYDNLGALNGTSKGDQQSVLWSNQDEGVVQSVTITTTKHMKAPVCFASNCGAPCGPCSVNQSFNRSNSWPSSHPESVSGCLDCCICSAGLCIL